MAIYRPPTSLISPAAIELNFSETDLACIQTTGGLNVGASGGESMNISSTAVTRLNSAGTTLWTLAIASVKADATNFFGFGAYNSATETLYIFVWKSGYLAVATINATTGAVASGAWGTATGLTSNCQTWQYESFMDAGVLYSAQSSGALWGGTISSGAIASKATTNVVPANKLRLDTMTLSSYGGVQITLSDASYLAGETRRYEILVRASLVPYQWGGASAVLPWGDYFFPDGDNRGPLVKKEKMYDLLDGLLDDMGITDYTMWRV